MSKGTKQPDEIRQMWAVAVLGTKLERLPDRDIVTAQSHLYVIASVQDYRAAESKAKEQFAEMYPECKQEGVATYEMTASTHIFCVRKNDGTGQGGA